MVAGMQGSRINQEIQVLRAIAVLAVMALHSTGMFYWNVDHWKAIMRGGGVGVDLFLSVSGFVIMRGVAGAMSSAHDTQFWRATAAFWIRRLYRITPSAWLWVLIPIPLGIYIHGSLTRENIADAVSILTHTANVRTYYCAWVDHNCGDYAVYWSLSLEEQFYLALPFLFLVFRSRIHYALIAIVALQFFLPRHAGDSLMLMLRTDGLAMGALLGLWSLTPTYRIFDPHLSVSRFRFVVGPALLFALFGLARYEPVPFTQGMVALVSTMIVWLCSYDRGYFMRASILRDALAWIGDRSFAMYLIHIPAFSATRLFWETLYGAPLSGSFTLRFAIVAISLTIALADLNFRFIEEPLRKRGKLRSQAIVQSEAAAA
jgi:peptidoglycan/LPS O-acetylase OafA/YrhL